MYKDVARRVLAVILTICMAVTVPDATLLAVTADRGDVSTEAGYGEQVDSTETDETETAVEKSEETEETEETEEPETETESEAGLQAAASSELEQVENEDNGIMALDDPATKYIGELEFPYSLPNQLRDTLQSNPVGKIIGLEIKDGDYVLEQGKDYNVTAQIASSNRTATLTVTAIDGSGYRGELQPYTVNIGNDISQNLSVYIENFDDPDNPVEITKDTDIKYNYNGHRIVPEVLEVYSGSVKLESGQYSVLYDENLNVGDGAIIIRGEGAYAGDAELKFKIEQETVNNLFDISLGSNTVVYNKKAASTADGIHPEVTVTYSSDGTVAREEDYHLRFADNTNQTSGRPTAYVIVEPGSSGNCKSGTANLQQSFTISQANLNGQDITVKVLGSHSYTGTQITPEFEIYQDDVLLTAYNQTSPDYNEPAYGTNINAGKGSISVTGKGNYTGTRLIEFDIKKFNLGDMADDKDPIKPLLGKEYEYTGSAIEPALSDAGAGNANQLVYEQRIFIKDQDYTVSFTNNINVGRAYIVFQAIGNNCTGAKYVEYTIWKDINKDYGTGKNIAIDPIPDLQYTGTEQKPVPVVKDAGNVLRAGEDTYSVVYNDADTYTEVGRHTITVRFDGTYYRGSAASATPSAPSSNDKAVEFQIVRRKSSTLEAVFTEGSGKYTYTGTAPDLKYAVRIKGENIVLPAGDFTVEYGTTGNTAPADAGKYTVKIVPTSAAAAKYEMEAGRDIELTYTIDPKPIDKFSIQLAGSGSYTATYDNGNKVEPAVTVFDENNSLVSADHYTVEYKNNVNAGTATAEVTGTGNYTGTIKKEFTIAPKDLGTFAAGSVDLEIASVSPDSPTPYTYTGESIVPDVETLTLGGREIIKEGRAVAAGEVTFESTAVDASDTGYTFTIKGHGNYTGSLESNAAQIKGGAVTFIIEPRDIGGTDVIVEDAAMQSPDAAWNLSESLVEMLRNQVYDNGNAVMPVPELTYNGKTLTPPGGDTAADYLLAYKDNTEKTKDTKKPSVITISGQGNFKGTRTVYFRICEDIASVLVGDLDHTSYLYTSKPCRPMPAGNLTLDGQTLVWGEDYDIEWKNNVDVPPRNGENNSILPEDQPAVVIVGIGDFGGTKEIPFTIEPVQMKVATGGQLQAPLRLRIGGSPTFTGSYVTPTLSIQYAATDPNTNQSFTYDLVEGKDYDFLPSIQQNINAGAGYSMQIRAKGNFTYDQATGIINITLPTYVIKAKQINSPEIKVEITDDLENIGLPAQPEFHVIDTRRSSDGAMVEEGGTYELRIGTDYTFTYLKNTAPGQASIQMTGKGNYSGKASEPFTIPGNLNNATITFTDSEDGSYLFTGSEIKPKIRVEYQDGGSTTVLKEGTDYTYTVVGDNINSGGNPMIHLEGKSAAYAGQTKEQPFTINPRPLDDSAVRVNLPASVNYDEGRNVEPLPTIILLRYTLIKDTDYTCTYENPCALPSAANNNKKYKVTIRAKGSNFTGQVVKEYTIGNNFDVTIRFKATNTTTYSTPYTGEAITPELIVVDNKNGYELVKGKDYEVSYTDNINAGRVTMTVYGLAGLVDEEGNAYDTEYCGNNNRTSFTIEAIGLGDATKIKIDPIDGAFTYNASPRTPEPAVTWLNGSENGVALEAGTDFVYAYASNTNAGNATVTVRAAANRNFTGTSAAIPFTINPKSLRDVDVVMDGIPDHVYTGGPIDPKVTIHWQNEEGELLEVPEDGYTAKSLGDNINVGSVEVEVTGKGNFVDTYKIQTGEGDEEPVNPEFRIVKVKMSDVTAEYESEYQYTGKQITPDVKLTYQSTDGETIEMNSPELWGYTVTYGNNQALGSNSGTITITPNPSGNCEGDALVLRFAIVKRHIDDETISMEGIEDVYTFDATKETCEPKPILTFKPDANTSYVLREGYDYVVEYTGNDKVTTSAKITVKGIGNFDRFREQTFAIVKNLADYIDTASLDAATLIYNGATQHPKVNLTFKLNTIEEGRDYELIWDEGLDEDCVSAGEHTLVIRGKGEYSGEVELKFTIQPRDIRNITFDIEDQPYIGSAIEPVIVGIDQGIDPENPVGGDVYEITGITNNTEVGTATVTISAVENSNYTGTSQISFNIVRANLEDKSYISVSPIDPRQMYTGEEIQPEVVITDSRRNVDGTAMLARDGECYTLQENVDYKVTYENNTYPVISPEDPSDFASVTIEGIGNYEGTVKQTFYIVADLALAEIDPIPAQEYKDGEPITPPLTVRLGERILKENFDYTVTYANNTERGVATATITAVEGTFYTGSQTVSFNISRELTNAEIRLINTTFTYTGSEIRPAAAVLFEGTALTEGTDYEVTYKNNVNVGTAEVIITGIGGYDGGCSTTFTIIKRSIIRCEFGGIVNKVYDGSATTQAITVKEGSRSLVLNQDYTIAYAGNAAPGIATITITGVGNYGGTKTIRYQISVADMTKIRAKGSTNKVTLSWPAVAGAEGYAIYDANYKLIGKTTGASYTHKNLSAVTTYTYNVRPYVTVEKNTYYGDFSNTVQATTTIAKPVVTLKAYKKKMRVSWKKIKGVSGYEIYRSTKKTKGYKKIKTAKKANIVSYTNKSLKSKKRYYYKIRAYKKVNGRKVYSKYSSPKSVKTK